MVREQLRRMPARQRELGLLMVAPVPTGADQDGGVRVSVEQLRAYLESALRHQDMIVSLSETNQIVVVMPGSNKSDAARLVDQLRQRLSQDGFDPQSSFQWGAAAYEQTDSSSQAVIERAEAGLRSDQSAQAAGENLPTAGPAETRGYLERPRADEARTALS